jgi:hypothetical protein
MIEGWTDKICSQFTYEDCPEPQCKVDVYDDCLGGDNSPDPKLQPFPKESYTDYKSRLDLSESLTHTHTLLKYDKLRTTIDISGNSNEGEGEDTDDENSDDEDTDDENSDDEDTDDEVPEKRKSRQERRKPNPSEKPDRNKDIPFVRGTLIEPRVLPPFDDRTRNIFIKNKYYLIQPNQYDFDPNSNVPRSRGIVRSIGRRHPIKRQRKLGKDSLRKKPVKKVVKTDPKLKKTPPTFSKVINQLLPAIFILLIFIYFVHFFKKRS